MKSSDPNDPKGLIRESYRIDGITIEECRSIFVDWALSSPIDADTNRRLNELLRTYAKGQDAHPMTAVLKEGLAQPARTGRRGGRSARVKQSD